MQTIAVTRFSGGTGFELPSDNTTGLNVSQRCAALWPYVAGNKPGGEYQDWRPQWTAHKKPSRSKR